jgi:hypothetical protein
VPPSPPVLLHKTFESAARLSIPRRLWIFAPALVHHRPPATHSGSSPGFFLPRVIPAPTLANLVFFSFGSEVRLSLGADFAPNLLSVLKIGTIPSLADCPFVGVFSFLRTAGFARLHGWVMGIWGGG